MLSLMLMLLSTPSSATSCPNDLESTTRIETLRSGIQGDLDTPYERLLEALALKLIENCELRDQRNVAIDEGRTCATDRDHAAKGEADCKTRNVKLESDVSVLLIDSAFLKAENTKLKKQRWVLGGVFAGLGVLAGVFATIWVSK
jgi:hypothetical protein